MLTSSPAQSHSRLIHRVAVGCFYFLQGLSFASWGSRIPTIQQQMGLSEAELGGVLLALPVGLLLSLPVAGWVIAKTGSRSVVIFSGLLYTTTLVAIGYSQDPLQLIVALFVFGFAGNLMNISINTQGVGVEALYQKSIMASFHGLWSLAGFTGAAIGTLMIGEGVAPFEHFLLIMFLSLLVIVIASRFVLREDVNTDTDKPIFVMPDKSLIDLGIICFFAMICEGAMFDWSGVYFKKVLLVEKAWIGAGYTAFMCTMAATRFVADWFTSRFGLKRILQLSGTLTAAGLLISVVFPYLYTAMLGFALVGAGVSSVVPLVYGAAGRSKVMSPGVALAAVSTIGFFGFLLGPPLIGFIAGATSLRVSFTIIAVMGLSVALVATNSRSIG
ncbi:fucose permease [Pontibacter ummariensis]|uniref:Fucose permease n=1 Tax=Pontibacter ummariensis TaxID=1610492 RepID=A0A239KVD8_9BACT|nr:MFS transporter [Pontibacter ummariensis]PRY04964.1 fucose permease [Pontibacter ummariensis]SNT21970.1 Fucose permease [Pontibacter ummariensis]